MRRGENVFMSAPLIEALPTTGPLAELFSDGSVLQAMLDFEVALARAEARVGVIPQSAIEHIASAARAENFDVAVLAREVLRAGTPAIPVVKALTEKSAREIPRLQVMCTGVRPARMLPTPLWFSCSSVRSRL